MDGLYGSGLIQPNRRISAGGNLMKQLLAGTFLVFAAVVNSFSTPTNGTTSVSSNLTSIMGWSGSAPTILPTNSPPSFSAVQLSNELKDVQKEESNGQERVFDVSYETVTNKLSALKITPVAAKGYSFAGHELAPGQYFLELPESPNNDITGKNTDILVTRIDPKSTRVQMKTINIGFFFDTRDRKTETQRLNELSKLLSNINQPGQ